MRIQLQENQLLEEKSKHFSSCINSSDSFLFSTSLFVRSANHKRDWFIVNYGGQQLLLEGGINTLGCAGISNINLICYFFKDRGGDFSVKHQKNRKQ